MAKITVTYEFDNEDEVRAHFGGQTRAAAPVVEPVEPDTTADRAADPEPGYTDAGDASVDADGMPYDPEVHAEPKSFTSGGLWRSKRGKSDAASKRRAEFKAAGGAVTPPPAPAAAMPGLPGLPAAAVETRAEPVSYEALLAKFSDVQTRGLIDSNRVIALYGELGIDPNTFGTNESARAALYGALVKIEAAA